jgi:hypothetical protein
MTALAPRAVLAQEAPEPVPRFVVDLHGSVARYPARTELADREMVPVSALPARGLGLTAGGHVYVLRWGVVTFGVGAEVLLSRGRAEPEVVVPDPSVPITPPEPVEPEPPVPAVRTRFTAISPQLSFNFGSRDGWSYISGGIGTARMTVEPERPGVVAPEEPGRKTINYGGGARWFTSEHVAFSVDLRFYAVNPTIATATRAGAPRMTLMVANVGVSFK